MPRKPQSLLLNEDCPANATPYSRELFKLAAARYSCASLAVPSGERTRVVLKKIVALSMVGLGFVAQVGCDQQEAAHSKLDAAVEIFETAHRGYVPSKQGEQESQELQAYRQQALEPAVTKLKEVLQSADASAGEKVTAGRLLASVHLSRARFDQREATNEYASLAGRSTTLLTYLRVVEDAVSRVAMLSQSTEAKTVATLQQEIQRQQTNQKSYEQGYTDAAGQKQPGLDEVQAKLKDLQAQREQKLKTADEIAAKAAALRQQAFVAQGQAQYDLYDQADKIAREAAAARVQAEQLAVQIEVLQAQQAMLQVMIREAEQVAKDTASRIEEIHKQEQAKQAKLAEVKTQLSEASDTLMQEFSETVRVFEEAVQAKFDAANQRATQAIAALKQAVGQARGNDQMAVKADLLSAYVDQADILSNQAILTHSFSEILGLVAQSGQKALPQQAQQLTDAHQATASKQQAVATAANEAIAAGLELATELANRAQGESNLAMLVQDQQQRLQGYRDSLPR